MKKFMFLKSLLLFLAAMGLFGFAQAEDTALVTQLNGSVKSAGETVKPFSKLGYEDVITVSSGATLKIVYFDNGRQETWNGYAKFKVGAKKSESINGNPFNVSKISEKLARRLAKTPSNKGASRVGMVRLRDIDPIREKEIERNYRKYKDLYKDGNIAEIYKLNALFNMSAYDKVDEFLDEIESSSNSKTNLVKKYRTDLAVARSK